jgi:hypothetical protein
LGTLGVDHHGDVARKLAHEGGETVGLSCAASDGSTKLWRLQVCADFAVRKEARGVSKLLRDRYGNFPLRAVPVQMLVTSCHVLKQEQIPTLLGIKHDCIAQSHAKSLLVFLVPSCEGSLALLSANLVLAPAVTFIAVAYLPCNDRNHCTSDNWIKAS